MNGVDCDIKLRSAHVAPHFILAVLQCGAFEPITHNSVELRNAMANQMRSNESSLKLSFVECVRTLNENSRLLRILS